MARGLATSTVISLIAITIATLAALYYISVYTHTSTAILAEYRRAAEKPVLEVTGVDAGGWPPNQWLTVRITNKGPTAAYVKTVCLHKYLWSDYPTGVKCVKVGKYLGVGDELTINVSVTDARDYVYEDKPLRVTVVTDKGPVLLSYAYTPPSIIVNVHIPTSDVIDRVETVEVMVSCSGVTERLVVDPNTLPQCSETVKLRDKYACVAVPTGGRLTTGSAVVFKFTPPAVGTCIISGSVAYYTGVIYIPVGETPDAVFGQVPVKQHYYFYAVAEASPGGQATIDIHVPSIVARGGTPSEAGAPHGAIEYDFTWLFGEDAPANQAGVITSLVKYGIIAVEATAACKAYPYIEDGKLVYPGGYASQFERGHGVPFVWTCSSPGSSYTGEIGAAAVRVSLPRGKYLVLVSFSYDDNDAFSFFGTGDDFRASLCVYVGAFKNCVQEKGGMYEYVVPVYVNFRESGFKTVRVEVTGSGKLPSEAKLFINKILVLPAEQPETVFVSLTWPAAHVDLSTGSVRENWLVKTASGEKRPPRATWPSYAGEKPEVDVVPYVISHAVTCYGSECDDSFFKVGGEKAFDYTPVAGVLVFSGYNKTADGPAVTITLSLPASYTSTTCYFVIIGIESKSDNGWRFNTSKPALVVEDTEYASFTPYWGFGEGAIQQGHMEAVGLACVVAGEVGTIVINLYPGDPAMTPVEQDGNVTYVASSAAIGIVHVIVMEARGGKSIIDGDSKPLVLSFSGDVDPRVERVTIFGRHTHEESDPWSLSPVEVVDFSFAGSLPASTLGSSTRVGIGIDEWFAAAGCNPLAKLLEDCDALVWYYGDYEFIIYGLKSRYIYLSDST